MIGRVGAADDIGRQAALRLKTSERLEGRGRQDAAEVPDHRFKHDRLPLALTEAANMPAGATPVLAMAAEGSVDVRVLRVSAARAGCDGGCRGAVFDAELGVDLLEVLVHGPGAEAQDLRDIAVGLALAQPGQDLAF